MIKKITIFTLLLSLVLLTTQTSYGLNYHNFEDVWFVGPVKQLKDFTESDYDTYYQKVNKRKFSGWQNHIISQDTKVKFISQTMFVYHNDGKNSIDYHYKSKVKETRQYDIAVSGSLGINLNKNEKTFKNGLTASLKVDFKYKNQVETQEDVDLKIKIEPKTKLRYYYYGEGHITTGVAARYLFFIRRERGGFEIFNVTTHYPRLEILPI